jgi:hypothetical protein
LLRVAGYGAKRSFYIDHCSLPENLSDEYKVVKKYTTPPEIVKGTLTITFQDQDRHEFSFTVRDAWALREIFETFPWLQRPLNYTKNRSRTITKITDEYPSQGVFNHPKRRKH